MWDILVRLFAGVAMIGLAVGLGCLVRRVHASWGTFGWGALCFVLSQVAHIPFNALVLNPVFVALGWALGPDTKGVPLILNAVALGLSAGLFEETTRWLFYRYKLNQAQEKSFSFALMFGAGHGGCEAMIVGVLAVTTLVGMTYLRAHPEALDEMPADQKEFVQKTMDTYWASSGWQILFSPLERIFAMSFHLSASVLVWQGFVEQSWRYYAAAVAFHTVLDAMAVYLLISHGVYAVEISLVLTAFPLSLYILWYYYRISRASAFVNQNDLLLGVEAHE